MDRHKILVVDDDSNLLFMLERRLTLAGFDVVIEVNALKAVAVARSQKPDLIILDVHMPEVDGGEVAQRLKEDPVTKDTPILFLTCLLSSQEATLKRHYCGGHLMLSKQTDIKELISVIRQEIYCVKAIN
ncbi:MAG: response regulator [Phycisphaerae bacterium]|nr:response regulator [Phycisphaerae bacterium]